MGTQFWWFYDVMAAAIVLICVFLSGKKGVMKGTYAMAACFIAAILSVGLSSGTSNVIFEASVKTSSIRRLDKNVEENTFVELYSSYLETLGYNIRVNRDKVEEIFDMNNIDYTETILEYVNRINGHKVEADDEVLRQKLMDGYASVVKDLLDDSLNNKYISESAYQLVRTDKKGINKMIPLITNHTVQHEGSVYIIENYASKPYKTFFRLISFELFFLILSLVIGVSINAFVGSRQDNHVSTRGHIGGGAIGIFTGCIFVFAAAILVRIWALTGSNEMLFFNNDVVDKSYVFKYFYKLAERM